MLRAFGWLATRANPPYLLRMTHVPRHVPARTNDGWSVAGIVILLAAACIVAVTIIHQRTYKHPTDPTFRAAGAPAPSNAAPGH